MSDKFVSLGGGGVTSCLGMRLYGAIKYFEEHGKLPDEIDSSGQFLIYRDKVSQDVSKIIIGEYKPDILTIPDFDPGWQFAWYDKINLSNLSKAAMGICPVSSAVGDRSYGMLNRVDGRTALLYRGNDKALDIPRTHYQGMIEMALDTGSSRFIVQTDEDDFYEFFKERFPDTICFEELPRIKKDPDSYVMPPEGERVNFCINFLAAIRAISKAPKLIVNTGNTGLWTLLFRGNTENVWQIHASENQKWRKLNH